MNLQLATQPTPNRMSSREVASLTGKRHDNVLRDIREMVAALHSSNLSFVCEPGTYVGGNGQLYDLYNMDKDTTICLLTGYDVVARMKVVQRWQQLENGPVLPQTKAEAYRALAEAAEREEQLVAALAEAQPAKDFYDAVVESNDAIPVSDVAKVLGIPGMGQIKLFEFLREQRILMSTAGHWNMPYQDFINRGYFRVVERKYEDQTGQTRISFKTLVYQKGLDYIRKALSGSF